MSVQTFMPEEGDDLVAKMKKLLAEMKALKQQREALEEEQRKITADHAQMGIFHKTGR